jgi:hypothetical protein
MRKNVLFCIILSRAMVLPLKNGFFLAKLSTFQNMKVAIYKGLVILGRQK